jgi:hypothetical protein
MINGLHCMMRHMFQEEPQEGRLVEVVEAAIQEMSGTSIRNSLRNRRDKKLRREEWQRRMDFLL